MAKESSFDLQMKLVERQELKDNTLAIIQKRKELYQTVHNWWNGNEISTGEKENYYHNIVQLRRLEMDVLEFKRARASSNYVHYHGKGIGKHSQ
jgi:hypothetical protein